jgi:iron(III) transport system substrate-binding protein
MAITQGAEESRVAIISPHNEAIRYEFGHAFAEWHQQHFSESASVEWRDLGGSTDAQRFVLSEFAKKPEGIGIDCFFGGGKEPFLLLADRHLSEAYHPPADILQGIPQNLNGVEIYAPDFTWFSAALSTFGILENLRVHHMVGLPKITRWNQLTEPVLYGWVGAGDPRNSGSMNTMFESLLQGYGWKQGWQLLTSLGGNVRKFDRFSSNTAKDVTLGETADAMAIDFYALTQVAVAGRSNLTFILPEDVSVVVPDGIAILKGAPHPLYARRFVDFVLSDAGQKLWFLPRGSPGGPRLYSLDRMTIRPDFYRRFRGVSNIEASPFDLKVRLQYDAQLARERRDVVADLIGALLVDTHTELKTAWKAIIYRGRMTADLAELGTTPISAEEALILARTTWKDPAARNQKKIEWQQWAQRKYQRLIHARSN